MSFGSRHSGVVSPSLMRLCIRDAKMFGDTVVFSDTNGAGTRKEVALWAQMAIEEGMKPALHLHHRGDESKAVSLRAGLLSGIKEFDSSIQGLGVLYEDGGANLPQRHWLGI